MLFYIVKVNKILTHEKKLCYDNTKIYIPSTINCTYLACVEDRMNIYDQIIPVSIIFLQAMTNGSWNETKILPDYFYITAA